MRPGGPHGFGRLAVAAVCPVIAALWTWTTPGDPRLATGASPSSISEPPITAHLLDNGFHTDLAVPRAAFALTPGPLAEAVATLGPGDWILIGWGDAKFYVDQRPIGDRIPDGARAFFAPGNASVLMLDPDRGDVLSGGKVRRSLVLSRAGFTAMARRIERSLDLSAGPARVAAVRPGDDARFFASRETFSILHLCNHWTGSVLNAAGLPVRPLRSITSAEVIAAVDRAQGGGAETPGPQGPAGQSPSSTPSTT